MIILKQDANSTTYRQGNEYNLRTTAQRPNVDDCNFVFFSHTYAPLEANYACIGYID